MKDKNGTEWVEGKHKESIVSGVKCPTKTIEAFGNEFLLRSLNTGRASMWDEEQTAMFVEFVEPPETVDDIRAEILDLKESFLPISTYCHEHGLGTKYGSTVSAMAHIIDRVVKAMEDAND